MTILTKKSNKYEQCRVAFREHFNNGLKPSDGSQPMSDDQAKEIVQRLINAKVPKDGLIGVLDAFLILCTHLKEAGYNNIVLLEQEHQKLTKKQKEYYNKIKILCEKSNIQYYIPPNNNYENCKMNFSAALGNPAYKDQIHLKMLLILLERSDTVILTHPSGWLTRFSGANEKAVKAALKGRLKKLTIYNGSSKFPKAEFQAPLVVTEAVRKHTGPIEVCYENTGNVFFIDSLDDFPSGYWEPTDINYELKDYIYKKAKESNILELRTSNMNMIPLALPATCGHINTSSDSELFKNDFFTFFYRNSKMYKYDHCEGQFYSLTNEDERESLVSYLKTKFARFALALNKSNNWNVTIRYLEAVPLPPLDRLWTEESIMDYYDLRPDQRDNINEIIPNYY